TAEALRSQRFTLRRGGFIHCFLGTERGPQEKSGAPPIIYLWPSGAATLKGPGEKEITEPPNPQVGQRITSIKNVHTPSIEVHLPAQGKANGTAIVVAPGGGHERLVWGSEGTDIADWLNGMGVAAMILKYRLARTPGYKYTVEGEAL